MTDSIRRRLPNTLTMLRLVLAAAFFGTLNVYRYPDHNTLWANIAVVFFVTAAITDAFDGYLARKWHVESVFGRIMDPFCDKVLVLGAFIYLAGPRFIVREWVEEGSFFTMATGVYPWMVVIVLARELLVTGFRGEAESMGVSFASNWVGLNIVARWICYVVVYLTVTVTILSGLPYVSRLRSIDAGKTE